MSIAIADVFALPTPDDPHPRIMLRVNYGQIGVHVPLNAVYVQGDSEPERLAEVLQAADELAFKILDWTKQMRSEHELPQPPNFWES